MECQSMLFVKNHIPYLWDFSNSFSTSFIDFYSCEGFHQVIYQKEWSIKLHIDNDSWHEALNLLHVSRCKMLHFVTSYMKQIKSRKQTLETAQYGLEISFNTLKSSLKMFDNMTKNIQRIKILILQLVKAFPKKYLEISTLACNPYSSNFQTMFNCVNGKVACYWVVLALILP